MATLEFFYDLGSPYSYLAAHRLAALGDAVTVAWRPFLLGAVFKATHNQMPAATPAKGRYMLTDLYRQSARTGTPFAFPASFPLNTLLPQRILASLGPEEVVRVTTTLYDAYWVRGEDISQPECIAALLGEEALGRAQSPEARAALRAHTDEAVARGAFGAPTFFVGEEMFFGHDRLEQALELAACS